MQGNPWPAPAALPDLVSGPRTFRKLAQGTEIHLLSQVFDGAVIILSLAPMVASTVANGPRSPWDAISLIIVLRIWRVKRVIDGEWPGRGEFEAGKMVSGVSHPLIGVPAPWSPAPCPIL